MKRIWIFGAGGVVALVLVAFGIVWFSPAAQDAVMRRIVAANVGVNDAVLGLGALHVVLCGTGSPMPDPERAQSCAAVYAGGKLFMVDAGLGGWDRLAAFQLPVGGLTGVLITHFHSDHISGLPDIALNTWAAGRREAMALYGPPGIEDVAAGFDLAYSHDDGYRIAHHGPDFFSEAGAQSRPIVVDVPDRDSAVTVFDEDGVKVTAFRVSHEPVDPAYGYRIDYQGRSVVFSGDTGKDANIARFGAGADVIIHDALAPTWWRFWRRDWPPAATAVPRSCMTFPTITPRRSRPPRLPIRRAPNCWSIIISCRACPMRWHAASFCAAFPTCARRV